ncbi:MAG TPA: hypothetical protein QF499_09990 [Gammaproteobacteria bacterium]|nr:hypothetical protein [Gammaproteobacteria bacterium]MDP7661437.1 hypothetical protein [Gammaproteobacteria bacterium]HJP39442.1 hypothetical protein [Gammaproteobacteria bacterium]
MSDTTVAVRLVTCFLDVVLFSPALPLAAGNFNTYKRLSLADCPAIDVHIINSQQKRPGGVGEPGLHGTAAALTNAIFAATGECIRHLPVQTSN